MKIDYKLSERLGRAAYSALVKQLEIESGGKPFQANGNDLVGMFLTANLVFSDLLVEAIKKNTEASRKMIVQDLIEGFTFCFLRNEKSDLH